MYTRSLCRLFMPLAVLWLLPSPVLADDPPAPLAKPSIIYKVQGSDERLEMVVHSSRILTMEQKITQTAVAIPTSSNPRSCRPTRSKFRRRRRG